MMLLDWVILDRLDIFSGSSVGVRAGALGDGCGLSST